MNFKFLLSSIFVPYYACLFVLLLGSVTALVSWCQLPREELERAAVMAVWSKALPLHAHCLSPLPHRFESRPGHVRTEYSGFLHYFQLASHKLATICINVTIYGGNLTSS